MTFTVVEFFIAVAKQSFGAHRSHVVQASDQLTDMIELVQVLLRIASSVAYGHLKS